MIRPTDTLIPVLKSNAYGHGLREMCQIISMIKAVDMVAVDNYIETQQVLHYTKLQVLMMGEAHPDSYHSINHRRVQVAVYSVQVIQALIDTGKVWRVHLFFNTGLNREGIQASDLAHVLELLGGTDIVVEGVMSHFACDDEDDRDQECQDQITVFKSMYATVESYGHTPMYRHINNTSGIIKYLDPWFNAHRLGKGLYWYCGRVESWKLKAEEKQESKQIHLKMVADVYSSMVSIQQVSTWQWVWYGYQRVTPEDGQIMTIPFGYAEWLTRAMSGQRDVRIHDVEYPLVGAISMNYSSARAKGKNKEKEEQQWMSEKAQTIVEHGDIAHVISSNPEHSNNRHVMARINHTSTRELLTKMDEKISRIII